MEREPLLLVLVRAALVLLVGTLARPAVALGDWLLRLEAWVSTTPRNRASNRLLLAVVAAGALAAAGTVTVTVADRAPGTRIGVAPPVTHTLRPARPAPIRARWLTHAGPYKVERIKAPQTGLAVDLAKPAAGVGHTTECSLNCALRVFRRHDAPTFLLGRDDLGRVRIFQFVPLGEAAASLRNFSGGVETNAWARAQIELASYSHERSWQPDAPTMRAFATLLLTLRDAAGIPLSRPYIDAFSQQANVYRRASGKWGRTAGWFNHGEIPEQNHWDMGAFRWQTAFALARAQAHARAVLAAAHPAHVDSRFKSQ